MATWLKKTWIEEALLSREEESLPRIARAQILKLEETSTTMHMVGIISDKKLFVKASFSQAAVDQFKRDNPSLSMSDIQGGLIFVKKYAVEACMDSKSGYVEFMLKVDQFKFAGGEGNTQFGSNLIDSSSYGPLLPRLQELWLQTQLRRLVPSKEFEHKSLMPSLKEVENSLLEKHNLVFIPDDMEKKLNEIPEWQPRYCPPQVQSEFLAQLDACSRTSNGRCRVSCVASEGETYGKAGESLSEENNDAVINSDCISSSQKSVVVSYPLRGLVTEQHCSSSSESSQVKTNSDESYSILAERSHAIETSPTVSVIASSNNTEETEIAQVLPYITPQMTDNQVHCSLTESQLENLLDTDISIHDVTSTPCYENVSNASQVGKTNINVGTEHEQKSTPCRNKLGNGNSSSKQLGLDNLAVSHPCVDGTISACQPGVSSSLNSTGKKFIFERVVSQTPRKCFEFDAMYSQNTRTFPQECEKECSGDLAEVNQHQSGKRKRSQMEADKAQLNDGPVSPKSTSSSVKSGSHSGSSRGQHSNHSSSICLAQPLGLYSQQDPLVLDTSADSTESTDGAVIDNVSGFLISHEGVTHIDKSPSELEPSVEEPCTLTTPTFDSLPSFQVPVVNGLASPDDTSPANHQQTKLIHSGTWHQETEARQESEPDKKKRKPRRRKFNWFSDAY